MSTSGVSAPWRVFPPYRVGKHGLVYFTSTSAVRA